MSKRLIVLPGSILPVRLPTVQTAVWWLLLDRLQAPQWVWGASGTVLGIVWFIAILGCCFQRTKPLPGYGAQDV